MVSINTATCVLVYALYVYRLFRCLIFFCFLQVEPNSLENVIIYLLDLSEAKLADAKKRANQVAIAAAARIADLEQEESPESIMLSSMTEDGSNERTDREVVVPWLKFIWESFRAVLELLYRLPKMEKLYHDVCKRAFQFCLDYNRKTEFRRLCEMLRTQLENLQKPQAATRSVKTQWEWTPEAIEFHMQTRFAQLDKATSLELWNEAFRTVEDVSRIMNKKQTKSKLMITYFERLTRIFWVADNKLFHAYALLKQYQYSNLKGEDKVALASAVVLAALTVPSIKDIYAEIPDEDDNVIDRNAHLASLLDFHTNPTRQSLLSEIVNKNLVNEVYPELASLYENLEVKFAPLTLGRTIASALDAVKSYPNLAQYAVSLERIIVVKVLQQLSRVYSTVKLDFVYNLLSGLKELNRLQIERVIVEAVRNKQLTLKISHVTNSLSFVPAAATTSALDSQAYQLGSALNQANFTLQQAQTTPQKDAEKAEGRKRYFGKVIDSFDDEYGDLLERKRIIEKRKEAVEFMQSEKEKAQKAQKESEELRRKREETARLEREEQARVLEKRKKDLEEQEIINVILELKKYGVVKDKAEIAALTTIERQKLIKEADDNYRKGKEEERKRLEVQSKNLDFRARAERLESFQAADRRQEEWETADAIYYSQAKSEMAVTWGIEHAKQLKDKARLAKVNDFRASFEKRIRDEQLAVFEARRAKEIARLVKVARDANIAQARKAFDDDENEKAEEEERRRQEEEDRRLQIKRDEALRMKKQQEEAAERDRERRETEQKATLQRMAREAEEAADRKRKEEEQNKPSGSAPAAGKYQPPQRGISSQPSASGGKYVPPTRSAPSFNDGPAPRREDSWRGSSGPGPSRSASTREGGGDGGGWGRSGGDREVSGGGFGRQASTRDDRGDRPRDDRPRDDRPRDDRPREDRPPMDRRTSDRRPGAGGAEGGSWR